MIDSSSSRGFSQQEDGTYLVNTISAYLPSKGIAIGKARPKSMPISTSAWLAFQTVVDGISAYLL